MPRLGVDVDDDPVFKVLFVLDWNLKLVRVGQGTLDHPVRFVTQIDGDEFLFSCNEMLQGVSRGVPFINDFFVGLPSHNCEASLYTNVVNGLERLSDNGKFGLAQE